MLSRRSFLKSTLGAGVALATQGCQQMAAQPVRKRTIVDAQVHMWKASTPDRPWVPGATPQLPEPFTIERVVPMMDDAASIASSSFRRRSKASGRLCAGGGKRYPGPLRHHGRIALDNPDRRGRLSDMERTARRARHAVEFRWRRRRGSLTEPRTGSGRRPRRPTCRSCFSPPARRSCSPASRSGTRSSH